MGRLRRRSAAIAATGAVALVALGTITFWPEKTRVDEIRDVVGFDSSCMLATSIPDGAAAEPGLEALATESARITCRWAGPSVTYLRFRSQRSLARALSRERPNSSPICVMKTELVELALDRMSDFRRVCRELQGQLRFPKGRYVWWAKCNDGRYVSLEEEARGDCSRQRPAEGSAS